MWSSSFLRVVIIFSTSPFSFLPGEGSNSRRPQQGHHVSAFLVVHSPKRIKIITLGNNRRCGSGSIRDCDYRFDSVTAVGRTKRCTSRAMARALMSTDTTQVDVDIDRLKNKKSNNSSGGNDGYNPDRDVESQAYQSAQGWTLKYHDIKTRRDMAEARAKVPWARSLLGERLERFRSYGTLYPNNSP